MDNFAACIESQGVAACVHAGLGITSLYYFLVLAAWGYFRFFRRQGIGSNYWGGLAVGEILIALQSVLGVVLWLGGAQPARGYLHLLYGAVIVIMIPSAYLYTKGRGERSEVLVYATVTLITVGLLLRAIDTAMYAAPSTL